MSSTQAEELQGKIVESANLEKRAADILTRLRSLREQDAPTHGAGFCRTCTTAASRPSTSWQRTQLDWFSRSTVSTRRCSRPRR